MINFARVFVTGKSLIFSFMNTTATKLTLVLDNYIVLAAKEYARSKGASLSKLVENYFLSLTKKPAAENSYEITPFVANLKAGVTLPADYDYKDAVAAFLDEKYK
jgi:hypothetical protein